LLKKESKSGDLLSSGTNDLLSKHMEKQSQIWYPVYKRENVERDIGQGMDLKQEIQCISGSTLKIIAVISMLIDHTAAFLLLYATPSYHNGTEAFAHAQLMYQIMRRIGRTAFPIFCFLLVEGFYHSRNNFRYLIRLLVFAVISEIPFDLADENVVVGWQYQNVFFTLSLGLGMMMLLKSVSQSMEETWGEKKIFGDGPNAIILGKIMRIIVLAFMSSFFIWAAEFLRCDYGGNGVLLILIFYLLRDQRTYACIVGYLSFLWEAFCFPAFLLIPFYNGKRGIRIKYLFYVFYPAHILVLYTIRRAIFI